MSRKRRVLAVGMSAGELARVAPFLDDGEFEVDRFPSARGALELVAPLPFEVLLVRHPLAEMDLGEFLDAVRRPATLSRYSSVVLLTTAEHREQAEGYIGRGANRVVCLDHDPDRLRPAVAELVRIAPRKAVRFLAQLAVQGNGHGDPMVCRVHNTSATGALVESRRKLEPGTRVAFELALPSVSEAVVGVGLVVRHTRPEREQVDGMGLRFLAFRDGSRAAFDAFLEGRGR